VFCCGSSAVVGYFTAWRSRPNADDKVAQATTAMGDPFKAFANGNPLGNGNPFDNLPGKPAAADPPKDPPKPPADPPPPRGDPVVALPKTYTPEQVYPLLLKSTVWIVCKVNDPVTGRPGTAVGSGSLVNKDERLVLTNHHVIDAARSVTVFFPELDANGDAITLPKHYLAATARLGIPGKVVYSSSRRDLALVQLDRVPAAARTLAIAQRSATPGQNVFSIGASGVGGLAGADEGALWRYTTGKVRLIRHFRARYDNGQTVDAHVVETDSPTNRGDSGGPMVNDRMQLAGVVSSYNNAQRGVSMSIDVREVRQTMKDYFAAIGKPWKESDEALPAPAAPGEDDQPPAYWVKLLRDPQRGELARERLVKLGAAAAADLRRLLTDKDPENRRTAAYVLGQIGDLAFEAVPELSAALNDADPSVRAAAAQALGAMGKSGRPAIARLLKAIADADAGVREAVAEAIKKIGPPGKDDVPTLAEFLKDRDPAKRAAAASTLRQLKLEPDAAVSLFAPLLIDPDKRVKLEAIKAVCEAGAVARPAAFGPLLALLDDADAEVRAAALELTPKLGTPDAADLPALQVGLHGRQAEQRRFCAAAIGAMGQKAAAAVPFVARCLSDPDAGVRLAAAVALAKMGPAVADVAGDVLNVRTDSDPVVRAAAIETLGTVGRKKGVPEALFAALADPDAGVRAAACKALRALKPPPGKDDLAQFNAALKSDKLDVRRFAATELARLGPDAAPILVTLIDALKDPDPQVATSVHDTLGAIGPKAKLAGPPLLEAMDVALAAAGRDPAAADRFRRASVTLGKIGQADQALPLMRKALHGRDDALKKEILAAFAAMGPDAKDAVPDLCALLTEPKWQRPAAEALAKIGKPAVDPLLAVIDKKPKDAKLAALDALARMKPEDAKSAIGDLASAVRTYHNEVGEAARMTLIKIQAGLPKKN
jgi:HEAT repeat protein/S1-C subfamily serine protease